MTDLTKKNLEAALLNLTKTDRPIAIKPTTWFGNPAKTAQWYTCPNCAKQSPLTIEWVGLTQQDWDDLYKDHHDRYGYSKSALGRGHEDAIEAKIKEKNK